MNHTKNFTSTFGQMAALMQEPATVYSNNAVAQTETETKTFLWDVDDEDTDVVLSRTVEYDATPAKVSETAWAVTTAPTISGVVSDNATNTHISLAGETTLTITGTNFGAEDEDLRVFVHAPLTGVGSGPHPVVVRLGNNPLREVPCVISAVNVGDTEITAVVDFSDFRAHGGAVVTTGACLIEVRNVKRRLRSDRFEGLEVVS